MKCLIFCVISIFLLGCDSQANKTVDTSATHAIPITVVQAQTQDVEIIQRAIGQIESPTAPQIAAEVAGRVLRLLVEEGQTVQAGQLLAELDATDQRLDVQSAEAEAKRLQALLAEQNLLVQRARKLIQTQHISQEQLDIAELQYTALREQLAGAQIQLARTERELAKTRILAPVTGQIQQRLVATGDFVAVGSPLFRLSTSQQLRVHLPFPETVATQLRSGQPVRLVSADAPDKPVLAQVSEIRPMVRAANRALDVIVDLENPGGWRPGASITGEVIVARRKRALTVPTLSVVQRPAGNVIYLIDQNTAKQQVVQLGEHLGDRVEILAGLPPDIHIAKDGAAFLSNGTAVTVTP